MSYEDFVYFILAEEDKSSEPSLEYWYTSPSQILGLVYTILYDSADISLLDD